MMSTSIYIERPDDETVLIRVGEEEIACVNHDVHGWAGMNAVENVVRELADTFGLPLYDLG